MADVFKISLAAARVNAKMTQADTASKMQVSKQTIANWELGRIRPKPAELEMMCRLYGVPKDNISLPTI